MSYTVLARKYRPQTFADLVGQEHVSRTIGNAITSGRVAHAFLFTGARGVGKTTTARLLAKALQCEKGPSSEPCNACDACREITNGTDIDVLEMDGASNNGVDDVRRLQETLPFRPARDRFKVVIVDEVHMLSTGAFNAFLKTLEEPPEHVKFIFATTEVHKVPVTIRSRCQRYDFRLIPSGVVTARVKEILKKEQIEADDDAIAIVAREAAGSMRDALTVLDQLLALGGRALKGEEVARGLGIASRKHVFSALSAMLDGDSAACLRTVHGVAEQGLDMLHFAKQLLECSRDLVVLRVLGDDRELVDLVDDERVQAKRLAESKTKEELERAFAGLGKLVDEVGLASTPHIVLEMGLVRLADRPPLLPLRELLDRLQALEEKLGAGSFGPGPGVGGPGAGGGGGDRRFAPPAAKPSPSTPSRSAEPARTQPEARPAVQSVPVAASAPATTPVAAPAATAARPVSVPQPQPQPPAASPEPEPEPAPEPRASIPAHDSFDGALPAEWLSLVATLKSQQPALGAVLDHGVPLEISATALRIGFPDGSFFGKQAQSPNAKESILKAAELVLGARPQLVIGSSSATKLATVAELEQEARTTRKAEKEKAALAHPRVRDAIEVFETPEKDVQVEMTE